jgi:hypothetical protein
MTNTQQFDPFILAYIEAALWSSTDDLGEPLDKNYDVADLSDDLVASVCRDCREFQRENYNDLAIAYEHVAYNVEQAGHDFWLSRNWHGAGFFDRGLGDVGQRLQTAASDCHEVNLYVGDDNHLYS